MTITVVGQVPTREALRLRKLLIQHTCRQATEAFRATRMDDLDDTSLSRCTWCGGWADQPTCRRCASTHPNGVWP
jgi:recombinational DNA repair protein RecR